MLFMSFNVDHLQAFLREKNTETEETYLLTKPNS